MLEDIVRARQDELATLSRTINQRMEWDQLSKIARLESALKAARSRIYAGEPKVRAGAH